MQNCQNLDIFILLKFDLPKFSKILKIKIRKRTMLHGKATLSLWSEPSHDYVGGRPSGYGDYLWALGIFSAVGLFLGRKSKIFKEQNVKEFQFYICMPDFRLLGSII